MKKKVALSATAIAVLASAIPAQVSPVQAAGNTYYVNSTGAGNQNDGGTGTQENPFKQLSTAVARAQDGDTIIVIGEGYVNDLWSGGPWVIDKDITIKGQGDVPPSLGIRPAGIVLEGNVKFEFVDINLYNASSAYMYANGHKLELINSTFSTNTQPIKLYAGLKADSSNQGSNGSIIVKTDSNFKGNGKKVAINTIFAGGESGTTSIPADIQVSQGSSSSITLTNIVGQDSGNADINSNMSVTLHEIDPTIYGGTGNNTLTMSSTNLRGLNMYRINTVNLTSGSFELTDDSITEISQLSIGNGATLDLTERWDDLTIGTYTGQGGIILPNDSTKVDITNPVGSSESLSIYLEGYNKFSEINGWHKKNFTYVTTANEDAPVKLYGDNSFSSGYSFIAVQNGNRYEWKVAKPSTVTPDAPNPPEEKDPVLTGITATQPTKSVSMNDFNDSDVPTVEFPFNIVTDKPLDDMTWFDQFNPTIEVNGLPAIKRVDEDEYVTYRVEDLDMTIYFELGDDLDDYSSQKMMVLFDDENGQPATPTKDTYEFVISTGEVEPLTLTLNVEGLESELPDGGEPEVLLPNITDITFDNDTSNVSTTTTTFTADYNFTVIAEGDEAVDLAQYPLTFTFGGVPASPVEGTTNKYRVEDKNLVITVFSDRIELSSDNISLDSGEHIITMVDEKHSINETFKLLVEEPQVGIRGFMQPNGGTLKEVNTEELAIPFTVGFDSTQSKPVPFYRLKYSKVLLGDKECLYDLQSGMYLLPNSDLALEVKALDTVGEYTAILRNKDDKTQPVSKGEYSFTLESSDTSAEFKYVVTEEPVLTGITLITTDIQIKNYSEFSSSNVPDVYYQFGTQTDGDVPEGVTLEFFEPTIKVGDHEATLVKKDTGNYYRVDDLNLNIEFEAITGTNAQDMNIKFIDKDGQPTVPTQESYEFTISKGDISPVTTQLRIEDFPKPEEPTPQPTEPTIVGFSQSSYSTTKLATDELAIPFTVNIDNAPDQPIAFNELVGSKVIFGGEEWDYVEGYYYKPRLDAKLEIEVGEQVGQYTAILKHSRLQEYLSEGDYSFTLGTPDNQATLKYTVKPSMYGFVSLIDLNRTFKPSDFLATEDQQPFFIFNVARTGESSDLDTYEEFKVTINGEETQKVTVEGDGKLYYQASNQMVQAYIDYDEESTNHTLVLQSYNGDVPLKEQYEVTLSHPSAGTLTLTANVKEEEVPPTPDEPEEEKLTYTLAETEQTQTVKSDEVNIGDNGKFAFKPEFSITDYDPYEFARGLTVTINGKPAAKVEGADEYLVDETGLCLIVYYDPDLYNGQGGYRVSFDDRNQTGNTKLSAGKYVATVTYGEDNPTATFTLNVEESKPVDPDPVLPPTPPVVDPEPEEPTPTPGDKEEEEEEPTDPPSGSDKEEEVKSPTVDVVIFPQGSTKTVDVSQATLGVELPLNLTLSQTETKVADFKDLGYSVAINGKTTTLNGADYVLADSNIRVTFTNKGNDVWQAFLFKQGTNGERLPLPVGTYNISAVDENSKDFEFSIVVKDTTPTPPSGGGSSSGGNSGGSSSGGNSGSTSGGNSGGTSSGGSNTGGSSSGGSTGGNTGGTTLPAPDPKPEKPTEKPPVVDKPTPVPPKQEETKPTTRPTVKPGAIASAVEALEQLSTTIKEKVDSLLTEVIEQAKGLVLDLTGDSDDLSSVSTLEVTKDGVFANVDGQPVKFATDLKLNDMSKLRITRADGSPIPYKTDGESFTLNTSNFSDILITERVVEPFVDVSKDDWFHEYVDEAFNRGITTGTTASTFSPNESITRGQLASILARAYELKPTGDKPALKDTANQWYSENVQALVDNGIIKGYEDGTFRGEQEVTREQLAVMLHRLAEQQGKDTSVSNTSRFTDTDKMTDYGKSAIEWAASEGIINSGNGVAFKPKSTATRAQVAKMLTLFMNK